MNAAHIFSLMVLSSAITYFGLQDYHFYREMASERLTDPIVLEVEAHEPVIKEATPAAEPVVDKVVDLNEVVDKVAMLESSGGKYGLAKTCRDKGQYNDWGYLIEPGWCFDDYEEGRETIKKWFIKHMVKERMSLEESLCHYNIGTVTNSCEYASNYEAL